ncbi:MAG: hypothetical protein QM635_05505 [Microbacteriaceae bacterium]
MTRPLSEAFAAPDVWHAPAAYWFWHHLPDPEQIRRQVGQMHAAGIRSFQIQARIAYPLAGYLDEDYLAACRTAVEAAAELDMIVGVYDEYNFQSGHAGGRVTAGGHDELRERQLFWSRGTVVDGRAELRIDGISSSSEVMGHPGMRWHYEGARMRWGAWEAVLAVLGTGAAAREVPARVLESREDGCVLSVELDPAEAAAAEGEPVTVFAASRSTSSRLIDYLEPRAVERFVEVGYAPMVAALGEHVGRTVRYFFFDQPHPNFYRWAQHEGDLRSAMPYHDDLLESWRAAWGARLARVLLALLDGDDAEALAIRARFYGDYGRLAIERYFAPIHAWLGAHGLLHTGHEVLAHVGRWELGGGFDSWDLRVNFGLDYFGIDAHRDLTAVDAQDANPQVSAKIGDSVARAHGRSGTIVEQYFGTSAHAPGVYAGHWGLTLAELRLQSIRHHLFGMRQLLFHGFYQTDGFENDFREYDNPRFDFPPANNFEPWFLDHHADFALESARLSEFLDAFVPELDTAVLYPLRTARSRGQNGAHAAIAGAWFEALSDRAGSWLLIDEAQLREARVGEGVLGVDGARFRRLVLPGVEVLQDPRSLEVIAAAARAGVAILASGATPWLFESGDAGAAESWARLEAAGLVSRVEPGPLEDPGSPVRVIAPPGVRSRLGSRGTGSGRSWGLALVNEGSEPAEVVLECAEGIPPGTRAWRAASGDAVPAARTLRLEPHELALLELGVPEPGLPEPAGPAPASVPPRREVLAEGWTLVVPADAHSHAGERRPVDVGAGWEGQGLEDFGGVAVYERTVSVPPGGAVLEVPALAGSLIVRVDGRELGRRGWPPYRVRIPAGLGGGEHLVQLEVAGHAANRYYAGSPWRTSAEPDGILEPPVLIHPAHDTIEEE